MSSAKIPRNFRLLEELEKGEKGLGEQNISYGLKDGEDNLMSDWACTIVGPGMSAHENRIYSLEITCGPGYPDAPPQVRFLTRINLPCVSEDGHIVHNKFDKLDQWKREYTMETILKSLRETMAQPANRKLPQPPEGATYD